MKVGLITPRSSRPSENDFYDCFDALERPAGSITVRMTGSSPARNRNDAIAVCLREGCTHLWFIDDDMVFGPDTLSRLLVHADRDVVTAVCLSREAPYRPVLSRRLVDGHYEPLWLEPTDRGVQLVANCGFGCVLIRAEVFQALEQPWVRLGELCADLWTDDLGFFHRVREAGFHLWCDFDLWVGHHINAIVWPDRSLGQWVTHLQDATRRRPPLVVSAAQDEVLV